MSLKQILIKLGLSVGGAMLLGVLGGYLYSTCTNNSGTVQQSIGGDL